MKARILTVAGILAVAISQLHAATITVNSTADSGPGSLRDVLATAADGDTIDASGVSGTILLTTGELLVTNSVNIIGPGPNLLAVNGNASNRVFHVGSNTSVAVSSLTVTNGVPTRGYPATSGGGVWNDHATLTISNCTVSGNASYPYGGGIYNDGSRGIATLQVVNSLLSGNSTDEVSGGIGNGGRYGGSARLQVVNSTLSSSLAHNGGAIYNDGCGGGTATVRIVGSTLIGNQAYYTGGAVYLGGGFDCGAGYGFTSADIANSTVSSNLAGHGGGIGSDASLGGTAIVQIADSTLSGNRAVVGGGVDSYGGGMDAFVSVEIANSTLSGNSAGNGGGGIDNDNATLQIVNSTFNGNSASGYGGGGIYNVGATVVIGSTILDVGASGGNILSGSGTITSLGYNLSSDDGGGFLTATGDQTNTNPMLDPAGLQDNGGPTLTIALQCGSPAIDQGKNFSGSATDQRGDGFARTFDDPAVPNAAGGDGTDIGAFEVQTACNRPPVAKCKDVTVSAGPNCTASASIDDGSYDPDSGDTITLRQSPAGPYGLGTTLVTLTVTDNHGASNSCSATVEVVDTTPSVPTVASLPVVSAQCSATLIAPTATDNCAGSISATTSDPTTYNSQGSFTVHWIYNDGNGNSVTQLQSVVIKDTVPPSITCPANVVADAVSPGGVNVTFPAPITSDNCSVASVTSSRASGSLFAIGTTTVTDQVVDEAGNTSACTFTVKVKNAKEQIIDLITLVNGLPIRSDIKIALDVKSLTALLAIDINRKPIGCAQLKDFIGLASAQNGKKLTAAQADLLIAEATRIRAVLGC